MRQHTIDGDPRPVWLLDAGEPLVDDITAWKRLGVGLRCETWLGWSSPLWSPVVVKLARPDQRTQPRARRSLAREIAALESNPHPALPRLVSAGLDDQVPHVVVEYIDGETLDTAIDRSPLDAASTALLATHLLSATAALHRRDIAHLDVKPENVVLRDGHPYLVDFGSARILGTPQPAGRPVGTPGYAAPEMEACEPIGTAMDVYGIGATVREAYTGLSVYDEDPLRRRAASDPPYPADDFGLSRVIRAMLRPEPAERPTVPEALDALADLFEPQSRPWPIWLSAVGSAPGP